jgi:hypothetical protein
MKIAPTFIFAVFFAAVSSSGSENGYEKILKQIDVSHPCYKNRIFGNPKIDTFRTKDSSLLLIYQAKYGGDGEHSENLLKIFKFNNDGVKKLIDVNIDSVSFIKESFYLKSILGKSVYSLCDVCDGWDVALPEDNFFIPTAIIVKTMKIKVMLSAQEKQDLLIKFDQQAKNNIKEQLSCGNDTYHNYVDKIRLEITNLFK